jgi:predicted O-methyltransferase YrrM
MSESTGTPQVPDPSAIMQLSTAYWGAQVLLTANRIGLFRALGTDTLDVSRLAREMGTAVRPTELLLRACVGLGLVEQAPGGYRNTAAAATYLVPGRPTYLGEALAYSDDLYATWGRLEHSLREDTPAIEPAAYLGRDADQTRHFVRGMHNRALAVGRALVGLVDLAGREKMLDIGGGPGTYSSLFAQRYPRLRSIVLDLPDVVAIAQEIIAEMGAAERVATLGGSYEDTAFPGGMDVVLISGVLHREGADTCASLIRRAREALRPGGLLIVSDVMTDSSGVVPPFATLFGLNMLLTAAHGGVHRDSDVVSWMTDAGLVEVETRPFPPPMPHRVVMGVRPE